jgi:hypothetical protein
MKRTIALGAAWTASAAAAVGLGFLAVSLVDASASPGTTPVAATTTASNGLSTGAPAPSAAPAPAASSGEYVTVGGTVFASCGDGVASLAGAPAPGWYVDDSNDPGEVEFENDHDKVEVNVVCVGGVPQFALDDSSLRSSSSPSSSSSTGSPTSSSGVDDSDGRVGGGHGSDDGPGDDSSGRDGGGHGSDD